MTAFTIPTPAHIRTMTSGRSLARTTAGDGPPEELTPAQMRALHVVYSTAEVDALIAAATGIDSLNGLTGATQTIAVGTAGTDFAVSSSGTIHTFDLPSASATARGVVTTGTQVFAGAKQFTSQVTVQDNILAIRNSQRAAGLAFVDGMPVIQGHNSEQIVGWNDWATRFPSNTSLQFSSTTSYNGSPDAGILRNAAGQVDLRGNSGIRVRNYANSADAPLTAGTTVLSGNVTTGSKILVNGSGAGSNSGAISFGTNQNHEFGATASGAGTDGFYWSDRNADSATSIGGSYHCMNLATAGAKLYRWLAAGSVEKAYIGVDGTFWSAGGADFAKPTKCGVYTFATVPSASANTGGTIRISDRAERQAYSDGTNWRFTADDLVIS